MTRAALAAVASSPRVTGHGKGMLPQLFGWGLVLVLAYLVYRFVKGRRDREGQLAAAFAAAVASVTADIRSTAAANAAAAGGDARSAVAVNLTNGNGTAPDLDALTLAVADRLIPLLRAELSHDLDHGPERAELSASDGEGRGIAAAGTPRGALSRGAATGGPARGNAREELTV